MELFRALKNRQIQILIFASVALLLAYKGLVLIQIARENSRRSQSLNWGGDPEKNMQTLLAMRATFPVVPLRDRLQYEPTCVLSEKPTLSPESEHLLTQVERKIEGSHRRWMLSTLHDQSYETFVARAGFGQGRMWHPLKWETVSISQPELVSLPRRVLTYEKISTMRLPLTRGEDSASEQITAINPVGNLHLNRYFDFTNPTRLGVIAFARQPAAASNSPSQSSPTDLTVSRTEIVVSDQPRQELLSVGFMSHAMSLDVEDSLPEQAGEWNLLSLELVSMLKFSEPRVYVSTHMPNMEELKTATTRAVDEFEQHAINQLRKGEEIVVDSNAHRIRMVGAVRAASQCLECHVARRGDLLGAFSYSLDCIQPTTTESKVTQNP